MTLSNNNLYVSYQIYNLNDILSIVQVHVTDVPRSTLNRNSMRTFLYKHAKMSQCLIVVLFENLQIKKGPWENERRHFGRLLFSGHNFMIKYRSGMFNH